MMISRIIPKKELQKMILACRNSGLNVIKTNMGYDVVSKNYQHLLLKAAIGRKDYLVRMEHDLFTN